MKYFLLSCAIAGAFLLQSCSSTRTGVLNPEEAGGWLVGPVGGLNLVSYKTDPFAVLSTEPDCFQAQNGSDVAFHAGLTAEVPLTDNMQNFIVFEALFDSKSSKFTTANNTRSDIPTKLNGVVAPGSVTTDETATLNYAMINAGYKYNFTTGPSPVGPAVQLCLSVGVPLGVKLNKTVTVAASSGNGGSPLHQETQTTAVDDASNGVSTGIRVGIRAQFDYDIPLTGNGSWTLTPAVGYDQPFTKVDNSSKNWMASSAYGQVAIRYMLGR
jgi:hypothetical protein